MPTFWLFASTLVFFGLATSTMMTTANGFVQTTSDPAVRGRVLALYMAILMGGTPIGAPLVGAAADVLGPRSTFVISGVAALIAFAIGMTWLMSERQLRLRWDGGPRITHAGRPGLDDSRAAQVETLTAPLDVLRREPELAEPLDANWESAPQETAPTTGIIPLPGRKIRAEDEEPEPNGG